jgi:hypothetical protein
LIDRNYVIAKNQKEKTQMDTTYQEMLSKDVQEAWIAYLAESNPDLKRVKASIYVDAVMLALSVRD